MDGIHHKQQPQKQAHQKEVLVKTAQLHVLVALMAEPLAHKEAFETLCDGCHLPCHGAPNDHEQAQEEEIAERLLQRRILFSATNCRRKEQACCEEAGGNREDCRLRVPGACHSVGDVLRQPVGVAHVALDGQVDRVHPKADLEAAQEEDDVNPLHHGGHGGRHHKVLQRILQGSRELALLAVVHGPDPGQGSDAEDQESQGGQGPDDDLGRDGVAHQALLGPVVGVGMALTRPLCDAGPSGPEDEASQLLGLLLAVQSHVLDLEQLP
mmetsp:Transcript_70035/g.167296  ORF Transcript_70035/g.167296 Transcript_70035/m.167296 type:complete len:268 (+) Transcript_70035:1143-1946(+)